MAKTSRYLMMYCVINIANGWGKECEVSALHEEQPAPPGLKVGGMPSPGKSPQLLSSAAWPAPKSYIQVT